MTASSMDNRYWNVTNIGDQTGRIVVVTGANSGIGFEAAKVLAERGATVVLACRNLDRGRVAASSIIATAPHATVSVVQLDLSSLASVRAASEELRSNHDRLDVLINNAGLMAPPYGRTEDGFELQFGTNHLGHFALTGLLLDCLTSVPGSRIVSLSSVAHRMGRINFEDLQFERRYRRWPAYAQSKLATLMFAFELQRRLEAAGAETISLAAHPGWARTNLQRHTAPVFRVAGRFFGQSEASGALPTLRAATDPQARGGKYYGPGGLGQMTGPPVRVGSTRRSRDVTVQRRLWQASEQLSGVTYSI